MKVSHAYDDADLVVAVYDGCRCGAPMAYVRPANSMNHWVCVRVLRGDRAPIKHTEPQPMLICPGFRIKDE